jgi:hypothetical protein
VRRWEDNQLLKLQAARCHAHCSKAYLSHAHSYRAPPAIGNIDRISLAADLARQDPAKSEAQSENSSVSSPTTLPRCDCSACRQ